MAVTWATGFEGQAQSLEQNPASGDGISLNGTSSFNTATVRTGAAAIRCNPASGASGFIQLTVGLTNPHVHFGLRIATLPSLARRICGNGTGSTVKLNSDGTLELFDAATSRGSSAALSTNTWYWIGWRTTSGTSVDALQVDGVTAVNGTIATSGAMNIGFDGTEASAADVFLDDLIADGAGFLQPSKVDMALPISDNTRTAVTTNAGGTTNLWDCVNNTPPAGVASASEAAAGAVSILYPASLTEDYIANLETYTTLGIGASDTVLAVQSFVRHGEDIATGTKNIQNVGALTNPTVAGVSVTAGNDAGAHGAETGLWRTTLGTLTTSPSVTLGTSPTIRTSRTSETRVACIDFMGMNVAWTPAVVTRVPKYQPYPQLLAH